MKAIEVGGYVLAGSVPLCRPATVYRVAAILRELVTLLVVHAPHSPHAEGRRVDWPRRQLDAAWEVGDIRVAATWTAPTESLREVRDRLLESRKGRTRRAPRALTLVGGGTR